MKRIFGTKKPATPGPTIEQASDKLNLRGDRLDEQIRKLEAELFKYREQIKKARGPAQESLKRRALNVLKQKRMFESQRDTLYQQQFNMENTRFTVESIQDTVQTVQALKGASNTMKVAMKKNKELDLNYIDKLQDELADMADLTNEINEMMGRSYDVPEDVDETDLMAELDALEDEIAMEGPNQTGVPSYLQDSELPELPSAPAAQREDELGLPMAAKS